MERYAELNIFAIIWVLVCAGYFALRNSHPKPLFQAAAKYLEIISSEVDAPWTMTVRSEQ